MKLFVRERGSEQMMQLADSLTTAEKITLRLSELEFKSALHRRRREGSLPIEAAEQIANAFAEEWTTISVLSLTEMVMERATSLVAAYPLRAMDALHLAGCLTAQTLSGMEGFIFVCSDSALLNAARQEGLTCFDPANA